MTATTQDRDAARIQVRRPQLVGHRGAAEVEPENTIRSFRRGVVDGSAWLECDVHLSADGHDVIIHDATIDRTAQADSPLRTGSVAERSEEHTSELQSRGHLVCRLLLEKKKRQWDGPTYECTL